MRKIEALLMFVFLLVFSFVIRKTYEAHTAPKTIERDAPTLIGEVVELSYPEEPIREIPEVRFTSFEDEFAVDPIIRNLTEQDKKELRLIAEAEDLIDGTEGMLWVMLTVVNRIRANGGTVHSTIYAENQYYTAGMAKYPTDASEEAINLLMCGYDPSEGAKYFRTRHYHSFGEPVAQVGHHYYSR